MNKKLITSKIMIHWIKMYFISNIFSGNFKKNQRKFSTLGKSRYR